MAQSDAINAILSKIAAEAPKLGTGAATLTAGQIKELAEAYAWLMRPDQSH